MTKSFKQKRNALAVACALASGMLSGAAGAQDASPQTARDRDLVRDNGGTVVMSGFGLCWHNGFGPPPPPSAQCEPMRVAEAPPQPVLTTVAAPPPPPMPRFQPPEVAPAPVAPPTVSEPAPLPPRRDRN